MKAGEAFTSCFLANIEHSQIHWTQIKITSIVKLTFMYEILPMTTLKADSVTKQKHQMDNAWLYWALKENFAGGWLVSISYIER